MDYVLTIRVKLISFIFRLFCFFECLIHFFQRSMCANAYRQMLQSIKQLLSPYHSLAMAAPLSSENLRKEESILFLFGACAFILAMHT